METDYELIQCGTLPFESQVYRKSVSGEHTVLFLASEDSISDEKSLNFAKVVFVSEVTHKINDDSTNEQQINFFSGLLPVPVFDTTGACEDFLDGKTIPTNSSLSGTGPYSSFFEREKEKVGVFQLAVDTSHDLFQSSDPGFDPECLRVVTNFDKEWNVLLNSDTANSWIIEVSPKSVPAKRIVIAGKELQKVAKYVRESKIHILPTEESCFSAASMIFIGIAA